MTLPHLFQILVGINNSPRLTVHPETYHAARSAPGLVFQSYRHRTSGSAHSLSLYEKHVGASWKGLPTVPHRRFSLETVDDVLRMAGNVPGGLFSSLLMRLIVRALGLIMRGAGLILGSNVFAVATVADQIAYILRRGVRVLSSG